MMVYHEIDLYTKHQQEIQTKLHREVVVRILLFY